jgi:hypothetical protein
MYGTTLDVQDMSRSRDGGATWETPKLTGFNNIPWGHIFTDSVSPNRIYVGAHLGSQVQESDDGGDNWTQIGPPVNPQTGIVQVIGSTSPWHPLFVGTTNGEVWALTWSGTFSTVWSVLYGHPDPSARVVSMALAPSSNSNTLFVLYADCNKDRRVRRFQLISGSGWTSDWITGITGNLPEFHAPSNTPFLLNTIAVHPTDEHIVFVGTDKGVYQGVDVGQAWVWKPYNNFLPLVKITKLISLPLTGEIRAATYGRGVWTIKPYNPIIE